MWSYERSEQLGSGVVGGVVGGIVGGRFVGYGIIFKWRICLCGILVVEFGYVMVIVMI